MAALEKRSPNDPFDAHQEAHRSNATGAEGLWSSSANRRMSLSRSMACRSGTFAAGHTQSLLQTLCARAGPNRLSRQDSSSPVSTSATAAFPSSSAAPLCGRQHLMFLAEVLKVPIQELFPRRESAGRLSDFIASSSGQCDNEKVSDDRCRPRHGRCHRPQPGRRGQGPRRSRQSAGRQAGGHQLRRGGGGGVGRRRRFDRIGVLVNNAANFYAGYFAELMPSRWSGSWRRASSAR
jgi:hypothetical protein